VLGSITTLHCFRIEEGALQEGSERITLSGLRKDYSILTSIFVKFTPQFLKNVLETQQKPVKITKPIKERIVSR